MLRLTQPSERLMCGTTVKARIFEERELVCIHKISRVIVSVAFAIRLLCAIGCTQHNALHNRWEVGERGKKSGLLIKPQSLTLLSFMLR
jgi:predicted amino acid-binding ACT domain protein